MTSTDMLQELTETGVPNRMRCDHKIASGASSLSQDRSFEIRLISSELLHE